jgi:hypothetical protein
MGLTLCGLRRHKRKEEKEEEIEGKISLYGGFNSLRWIWIGSNGSQGPCVTLGLRGMIEEFSLAPGIAWFAMRSSHFGSWSERASTER